MSIHQLLEMSRRSFRATDAAINTAGQNIANLNTEGYTRRRITLQADAITSAGTYSQVPPRPATGLGVSVQSYERLRDGLLASAGWEARGSLGSADEQHRILSSLEALFPSSDGGSLHDILDDFWSSWSTLADNPTDDGVRATVRSHAQALTTTINTIDSGISQLREETVTALRDSVDAFNRMTDQIAGLNETIAQARLNGTPDLEAEDQRDQIVARLAEYAPLRVQQDGDEAYHITVGGMTVVQGSQSLHLAVQEGVVTHGDPTYDVVFERTDIAFPDAHGEAGKIGALHYAVDTTLPSVRGDLDRLAATLTEQTNLLHQTRYDDQRQLLPAGPQFFQYDAGPPAIPVTAASFRVSDAVLQDARRIAPMGAFTADGAEISFAIAGSRSTVYGALDGASVEDFVTNTVSRIGSGVKQAETRAVGQGAVVEHLDGLERGVSAVSLEEEMSSLIRFQQAYAASARVLNAAQEMMDVLLAL